MAKIRVSGDGVCAKRETLERGVEVSYAVLCEQTDEVEPPDWEFAFGRW